MLPKGIRQKIKLGFYFLLCCIIAIAALTYGIVREASKKIEYVEIINDFLNMTLEVRRFEKNYFLYGQEKDFTENTIFLDKLNGLLLQNVKVLTSVMAQKSYIELWDAVHEYKENIIQLHKLNLEEAENPVLPGDRLRLENTIRSIGKKLTDTAESASNAERQEIKRLLGTTANVLLFSVLLFMFLCILLAASLGRNIVNSLKTLENHTKKISRGEFVLAANGVADQEINSLLQAFNRMNRELATRQKQLVHSEKLASLGTLLSGVAHELNNPLSNVSSSAQILAEEIEDPDLDFKRSLVDQIVEQADRARDIVRTLLEFSRVRDFAWQDLLLKDLVEETIVLLRGQTPSQVEIHLDIPDNLQIKVDKQRMQQVFLNLIKNALDVVGEDGKIWVSGRDITKPGARREVEILIEDNGPGIPPEIREKIFDPFFTTKDVGHGSGLGLYIVHDIIEMHGGTLRVESRPESGTTFIIWLQDKSGEKT